jgi:uncharacterized membrane protein YdfJ with MMPL/SSD domain
MFNLISIFVGFVALLLAIPSTIPLLGWGNWFVLPLRSSARASGRCRDPTAAATSA